MDILLVNFFIFGYCDTSTSNTILTIVINLTHGRCKIVGPGDFSSRKGRRPLKSLDPDWRRSYFHESVKKYVVTLRYVKERDSTQKNIMYNTEDLTKSHRPWYNVDRNEGDLGSRDVMYLPRVILTPSYLLKEFLLWSGVPRTSSYVTVRQ